MKCDLLFHLIYHCMILLKLVLSGNCFMVCLEKFLSSMKNCYIQDCYLTILVLFLTVMRTHVYHFIDSSAFVSESMSRVKIIS